MTRTQWSTPTPTPQPLVIGWGVGVGVAVAYQLANQHPESVTAILAVYGVPDTRVGSVGNPLGVPTRVGQSVTTGALTAVGTIPDRLIEQLAKLPVSDATVAMLRATGFLSDSANPEAIAAALDHYLEHDMQWYAQLARSAAKHGQVDTTNVAVPAIFLAARNDSFVSPALIVDATARIQNAEVDVVAGGHFLPLENPAIILDKLAKLRARADI